MQLSAVQALPSSQAVGLPATQTPPWQPSPTVQPSPSLHAALLELCAQPLVGLQLSVVHTRPSSQVPLRSTCLQPLAGRQLSAVH